MATRDFKNIPGAAKPGQATALTNAQLQQQVTLAGMNNNQAVALANAKTIAGLDVLNLNNQQQAVISNSNLFRTFEVAPLNTLLIAPIVFHSLLLRVLVF